MNNSIFKFSETPRILVTDSGLGGISVFAEIERFVRTSSSFRNADLIFFNAYAGGNMGYNQIAEPERKLKLFDNALGAMINLYHPDIILIACNTLSVIYPETETYKTAKIPVIGIAEFAVEMIYENLKKEDNSLVILYGTPTTINSNLYKKKLVGKGIEENRIINQPCYLLESEILKNPSGEETEQMILEFTEEAIGKIERSVNENTKYFGAFCCTHYGYAKPLFIKVMEKKFNSFAVLNPNEPMSSIIHPYYKKITNPVETNVEVVSRAKIPQTELENIAGLIGNVSPDTQEALLNYSFIPDLFDISV